MRREIRDQKCLDSNSILLLNFVTRHVIMFSDTGNWGPSGCGKIVPTFLMSNEKG